MHSPFPSSGFSLFPTEPLKKKTILVSGSMVKAKHQKLKPKKQPLIKRQAKQADLTNFRAQLDALGLKIIQVTSDGNCFFRALADQLEGNEDEHAKYRTMAVEYILKHRDMFEPFIEDDVPFDDYCRSMGEDGTWAGHMELQVASLVTHCNICIHRDMSPRWYIRNFNDQEARMIHLSYHDGEHYNSVRLKEDTCCGPAREVVIKADAVLSATSHQGKEVGKSRGKRGDNTIDEGLIKWVMTETGCENAKKVEQVLLQVDGDTDTAIEYLVSNQAAQECLPESDRHAEISGDNNSGTLEADMCKKELKSCTDKQGLSDISTDKTHESNSRVDDKKIPRNKVCPCGSKKKYKSCCGSVVGRSSAKFVVNQSVEISKSKRERKQGKKGGTTKSIGHSSSNGGPPDMGALCI